MYSLPNATKNTRFGQLCTSFGVQKTRCRIYSCNPSDTLDYDDESQVKNYGTLLVYRGGDTDSNGRIASSGLKFTDYYNKDQDRKIGLSATTQIEIAFINDDGAMASFDWSYDAVVYLDIYDPDNSEWLSCPLGVFEWETPDVLSNDVVSARAHNFMDRLAREDSEISLVDYSGSPTLYDIAYGCYGGGGSYMGIKFGLTTLNGGFPFSSKTYSSLPYDDSGMSARESLEKIAEINYKNAYVDRVGTLRFRSWAYLPNTPSRTDAQIVWTISADTTPTHIKKLQIAEYDVPTIDLVSADIGQIGASAVSLGSGNEVYRIYDNGFFQPKSDLRSICNNLRTGVTSLFNTTYRPITVELLEGDPRIEGGDLVAITKGGTDYLLPVFQQTIEWRGGAFKQTFMSFGRRSIKDSGSSNSAHNVSSRIYNASSQVGLESMRSVASGSTETISVTFDVPFNVVPKVVACLFSSQTTGMGQCSASVYSISETGFSLRLTNNYSSARDLGATWIATT